MIRGLERENNLKNFGLQVLISRTSPATNERRFFYDCSDIFGSLFEDYWKVVLKFPFVPGVLVKISEFLTATSCLTETIFPYR